MSTRAKTLTLLAGLMIISLAACAPHEPSKATASAASSNAPPVLSGPRWDGGPLVADGVICDDGCTKIVTIDGQSVRVPMGYGWPADWRDRPHAANGTASSSRGHHGPKRRIGDGATCGFSCHGVSGGKKVNAVFGAQRTGARS